MSNRKSKKSRKNGTALSKAYRVGIVVVHGVGNQPRGATVEHVVRRLVKTFEELELRAASSVVSERADDPSAMTITVEGERPVLVVEGHWSDIVSARRDRTWAAAIKRLGFFAGVLPFLLGAAIGPRAHENIAERRPRTSRFRPWRWVEEQTDELVAFAPMIWRMLTAIGAVVVLFLAIISAPVVTGCVLVGLVVGALLLTRSGRDVLEHVRIAAMDGAELGLVEERVRSAIEFASNRCDAVRVIGHSQGGFVAHSVLSGGGHIVGRVREFTGVASGIRPISLIAAARGRAWIISGWVRFAAALLLGLGMMLAFEPGAAMNTTGSRLLSHFMVLTLVRPDALAIGDSQPQQILERAVGALAPSEWWWLVAICMSFAGLGAAVLIERRHDMNLPAIAPLPRRVSWDEVSSPNDLVGSMSVPSLPRSASVRSLPSLGHPIGDHLLTSYLGRRSVLRFELAHWLLPRGAKRQRFAELSNCSRSLSSLAAQIYRMRLTAPLIFMTIFMVVPLAMGASMAQAVLPWVWWCIGVAGIALVAGFTWWFVAASVAVGRLRRAALGGPVSWRTPRARRRLGVQCLALSVLGLVMGAWGLILYARMTQGVGGVAVLTPHLHAAGGIVLIAGLLVAVALWLALVSARGVRGLLIAAIGLLGGAAATLREAGDVWLRYGAPGSLFIVASIVLLLVLLFLVRRVPPPRP